MIVRVNGQACEVDEACAMQPCLVQATRSIMPEYVQLHGLVRIENELALTDPFSQHLRLNGKEVHE